MPQDLYDHVNANMTWRDDLFVFGVLAPLLVSLLCVVGLCALVAEPIRWIRRLMAPTA